MSKENYRQVTFLLLTSKVFRSSHPEVFCKRGVLRNLAKFTGKHLCQSLFLNKFINNFIKKETLAQVFSCEFYEISKNNLFYRTPLAAASWCLTRKFFLLLRKQKQPPEVFCKKRSLKNFAKFTEKHL